MRVVTARPAEDSVDLLARIRRQFNDSAQLKLKAHDALAEPIARATEVMVKCLLANGKILACGNGGSAADAQHFSAELLNRFERERPGLAAIALTTDTSTLTSIANDYEFEQVFSKQLSALGQAGDGLLATSPSGNSKNMGPPPARAAHPPHPPVAPSQPARFQEAHFLTLLCLCDGFDCMWLGADWGAVASGCAGPQGRCCSFRPWRSKAASMPSPSAG